MKLVKNNSYLLLIDEEAEIKEGDTVYENISGVFAPYEKEDIVENPIKVIAYYPLTKEVKELDLPLLPNPFEEEPLMKQASKLRELRGYHKDSHYSFCGGFIEGYKAAKSNKRFSLEDMVAFGKKCFYKGFDKSENDDANSFTAWREEYSKLIQSLSIQKLPKEFIPEYQKDWEETTKVLMESMGDNPEDFKYEETLKTITNSEGKQELVGTYKYENSKDK